MRVWIPKILIALAMVLFLLHLPAMPTAYPEVQVVTITIIPKDGK